MRLERLEIGGFGRVDELRIDFAPGLTVVLGPNESGKSTLHRAVRAALYGIDSGGQGRATARSDWARWRPWEGSRYGVALQYSLADGRRFRIARRLEDREERVQVQELGGREVTDSLRAGRAVVPGLFHLGIEEGVFAATAWVGEESLGGEAPDAPGERAPAIREALERLADAAGRATAAEALARLRDAMDRVGTEARSRTPLGAASQRLRVAGAELERVRARAAALGAEEERLRDLESAAENARAARLDAERAWLVARLCGIAAQRDALREATAEAARLERSVVEMQPFATFPAEREERLAALGVELRLQGDAAATASLRWEAARGEIRDLELRRAELAHLVEALGGAPRVTAEDRADAQGMEAVVAAEPGVGRRVEAVAAARARADGLRREVAAMGLGAVPLGHADEVGRLVDEARHAAGAARRLRPLAGACALVSVAATMGLLAAHLPAVALVTGVGLLVVAGLLLLAERVAGGPGQAASRRLARLCPGLDLGDLGLDRAAERLPRLRALHEDVVVQQAVVDAGRVELEEASTRLADLSGRCLELATRLGVDVPEQEAPPVGPIGHLGRARQALRAIAAAGDAGSRRVELEDEDTTAAARIGELRAVGEEAATRATTRDRLAEEIGRLTDHPLLREAGGDTGVRVVAFRQAAATRRQLEAARLRLGEVRRRVQALGPADDAALARQQDQLAGELARRGGDPMALPDELPLDPGRLHALEMGAQRAAEEAGVAANQATAMRERLRGTLDGLPSVADLEDEVAACEAVRDRCRRQLDALQRASALLEAAARRVHRDVAPRLAAAVSSDLAVLTDGRYSEVDVDAERFAVSLRTADRLELVPLELLSHGTRDQVGLLLRLALARVLGEGGEPVPLLLDDPLHTSDPVRRAGLVDLLARLAALTQVVVTTSDPGVAERLLAADGAATVIDLGRREGSAARPRRALRPARR